MSPEPEYDWPGWSLTENPYGEEFDHAARVRMVHGSEELLPLLVKYENQLGKDLLEIGPFFIPLLTPSRFPEGNITYWENDEHALAWLNTRQGVKVAYQDANEIRDNTVFDTVVASQILNYIDYTKFLKTIRSTIRPGGLLFLNNVAEHGLPTFFHDARPGSAQEVLMFLEENGYELIEKKIQEPAYSHYQKNSRLVGVWSRR